MSRFSTLLNRAPNRPSRRLKPWVAALTWPLRRLRDGAREVERTWIPTADRRKRLTARGLLVTMAIGVCVVAVAQPAQAIDSGDGLFVYSRDSNVTPAFRKYFNNNTTGAETGTVAGTQPKAWNIETSPTKLEAVAGYKNDAGTGGLQVMCYNGTSWTNEWTVTTGPAALPFDIGYEETTGDVVVLYTRNVGTTDELGYRTKAGSSGCGSANWSAETTLDSVRTSGAVEWVKLTSDSRASSNLIAATWSDAAFDLSAMTWSGTAWGNEPSAALSTALVPNGGGESFDLAYESDSGDLMVTWGVGGNGPSNLIKYATCTDGTATCTWSSVQNIPTVADGAANIDLSANPDSDEMAMSALDNLLDGPSDDLSGGYWSGSAWTGYADLDTTAGRPLTGRRRTETGWLKSGATTRWIITYDDITDTNLSFFKATPGSTPTVQTDVTTDPPLTDDQYQYSIRPDPFNPDRLLVLVQFEISGGAKHLVAYRALMDGSGNLTWANANGLATITDGLAGESPANFAFAYWQHPPPTYNQSSYRWFANADSADVGSPLAALNTPAIAPAQGTPFRLRANLHVGGSQLFASDESFKLQYAGKGAGTCAAPAGTPATYSDMVSSPIGPSSAVTAVNDTAIGTVAWTNPGNALAGGDVYAVANLGNSLTSNYLKLTDFGLSIPSGATITGIEARIDRKANVNNATKFVLDGTVKLVKGGTVGGTNQADTVTKWPIVEASATYGSSSDLWGQTWTPADLNASNFGIVLSAVGADNVTASVDHIQLTIHFTGHGLSWYDNATPADGATLTSNANDPTHGSDTQRKQTYEEANTFTNSVATVAIGEDGMWDFSLVDLNAPPATTYCLRAVNSDGTALETYTEYPEITTASTGPSVDEVMRHGNWFSGGVEQSLFWADLGL